MYTDATPAAIITIRKKGILLRIFHQELPFQRYLQHGVVHPVKSRNQFS
jgi:hypothetical protein